MARPGGAVHRRGRAAFCTVGGHRRLLRGLRPDGAVAAHRQPRAGSDRPPPAGRRPPALPAGRRSDGPHRRPPRLGRAHAQLARGGRRLGRAHPRPDRAAPVVRRRQRRAHGEQPGLDRAHVGDRVPARHRQALPPGHHAVQGHRGPAAGLGRGHQLHRVQLPGAAGHGLPGAVPAARHHAAARRQRPVGQPPGRRRADPQGRGGQRARAHDTADHQGRRHQVRQVRGRVHLARPGDDQPLRLLPVLAQPGRRRRRELPQGVHVPLP